MKTPEEISKEILDTIEPYVVEWLDSSGDDMRKDLLDTVTEILNQIKDSSLPPQ